MSTSSYLLTPGIELYWLTRHFKQYPIPRILLTSECHCCGYYAWPRQDPVWVGDLDLSCPTGLIVIGVDPCPSTIAHEYRHHLQFCYRGGAFHTDLSLLGTPHYWSQWSEHDALMFESRLHPSESNNYFRNFARMPDSRLPPRTSTLSYVPRGPVHVA